MFVTYKTTDGTSHYKQFANDQYHQKEFNWEEIGGDFYIPSGVSSAKVYIQINDHSVVYTLDHASCQQIPHDSQWQIKATDRIENTRKGRLNIKITSDGQLDTNGLIVQIKQTKSKFAFGTAFRAQYVTDSIHKAYQDFLYNNFEWVVPENSLKWKQMEWSRGHVNYDKGIDAVKAVKAHGMKVRGHNMFWGVPSRLPRWLTGLSSTELLQELYDRVNGMIAKSRGMLEHWDVNNENLHGDFFEQHLPNPNVTNDMFRWIHNAEPNVKLFLNEFNVVSSSISTTAYTNQGKRFRIDKVPIYGMGIQSHLPSSTINMDSLKYRLDKVAESGLPIWITELTIMDSNESNKAAALEDVMTMFFSHPAIEGILLWGFWDGAAYDRRLALATGSSVTPNAAGRKWQELFHQRFRTNETHALSGQTSISQKVFYGDYQLIFRKNGVIVHTENINMDQDGQNIIINL
ncbi:anti-sigma-I factor RsgI6-like [Mytilus californianus]|uniref:anti-sigma-I factor RsgI6-like n=1 Tax=Mytilus californianus TaxID=6549 RepID=UPI0022452A2B|nr:anti-sigma-I factor RsgI6-like [Mytilus californianus]